MGLGFWGSNFTTFWPKTLTIILRYESHVMNLNPTPNQTSKAYPWPCCPITLSQQKNQCYIWPIFWKCSLIHVIIGSIIFNSHDHDLNPNLQKTWSRGSMQEETNCATLLLMKLSIILQALGCIHQIPPPKYDESSVSKIQIYC
jgi:hypothetical protein